MKVAYPRYDFFEASSFRSASHYTDSTQPSRVHLPQIDLRRY